MDGTKTVNLKEVMRYAKGQLIGKYGIAICVATLPVLLETLITSFTSSTYSTQGAMLVSVSISIIVNLLIGILVYGQAKVFLIIARGQGNPGMSDFFAGFKENIDKAILMQLPFTLVSVISILPSMAVSMGLIVITDKQALVFDLISTLGQLLLILVVKLFLGLNFYILVDHPEYEVMDIYKKSVEMLAGNRIKYLLVYIINIPLFIAGIVACFIGVFWVQAYLYTAFANFYLILNGEKPWSIEDELMSGPQNMDNNNSF